MYGLLALGFYITYAVSSTVNFAQGSSMMLGAVLAYGFAVRLGWPMPIAAVLDAAPRRSVNTSVELQGLVRMFLAIVLIEVASLVGNYY